MPKRIKLIAVLAALLCAWAPSEIPGWVPCPHACTRAGGHVFASSAAPRANTRPRRSATPRPPTTRPAATQPIIPACEPLLDAVEGEWATYSSLDQHELRYDITRVTGALVTTRVTIRQNGKPLGQPAPREDLRDFDPLTRRARVTNAKRTMTKTKLKLAGRTWDALLYEDRWTDEDIKYVRRTWVSKDAPVFGLLRMELKGDDKLEARLELKTCGRPNAKPQ